MPSPIIYAVGDIHGELELLASVLLRATEWHATNAGDRPAWLVTLGDYVDRGPHSAGVIDLLMTNLTAIGGSEHAHLPKKGP